MLLTIAESGADNVTGIINCRRRNNGKAQTAGVEQLIKILDPAFRGPAKRPIIAGADNLITVVNIVRFGGRQLDPASSDVT